MAGTTKTVGILILAFWLIGAVITTVVDEFQRKHACIQDEGVLKGLFWCKTDQVDRSGLEHTKSLLYGLNWPIQLFGNAKPARNSTSASEEDHRLEKLAREMEECGIEVAPISATQKKCLMSKEVVLEGKKTLLEAMCEREARSYESFAKLRDAGVSRDKVLEWVDTRTPELARKMSSVLDESRQGELIEHVKEDVRRSVLYVYSHPDRTALEIRRERLLACLTSERHEMVKSQVSSREEGNANSPTNKPETAAEAFFVVQLAALSDPVKANELKERVMRAGLPAFTDRVERLTRVRVGPYESREAALIASAQLAEIGINGIVFEGTSSSDRRKSLVHQ